MGRFLLVGVVSLVVAVSHAAETRTIESDSDLVVLEMDAPEGADVDWEARQPDDLVFHAFDLADGKTSAVLCLCGTERVIMVGDVVDWDSRTRTKVKWIVTRSGPTPPEPPDPPDPPDPPTPPVPDTVPFPAPGLTVLVLLEKGQIGSLPPSQAAIFSSGAVLQWLTSNTVKLTDGQPAIRIWDDDYTDEQLANAPPTFRNAYRDVLAEADGRLPWIAISDGERGEQGPLPETIEDTLSLLRKYEP